MEPHIMNIFRVEVLAAHNACRELHDAPPLMLDDRLNEQSQSCAQDLIDAVQIKSSRFPDVGENICVMHVTEEGYMPRGHGLVKDWYGQRKQMEFGLDPKDNSGVNFSQLVWRTTRLLGVGMARNGSKIVIVCQYTPPGNIYGEYERNVLPPVSSASKVAFLEGEPSEGAMES